MVGQDPETGAEITAQNGRYGPYLKKGTDSRSLDERRADLRHRPARARSSSSRSRSTAAVAQSSALKEFDADPVSGKPIQIKDGRFGAYVTDGVTNATIPRGETVEDIDFERAVQLLADKRAKGPAKPKAKPAAKRKAPAKKPAAKKPAAKKPAAKSLQPRSHGWRRRSDHGALHHPRGRRRLGQVDAVGAARGVAARHSATRWCTRASPAAPSSASSCARSCCTAAATSPRAPRPCSTRPTVPTTSRPWCARRSSAATIVIQDRYLDSSVAYQGAGRVLGADEVRDLSLWAAEGLLPDLTVLLDLDGDGRARTASTSSHSASTGSRPRSRQFHARVREAFLALAAAEPERFLVVDAAQPGRRDRRADPRARRIASVVNLH